MVTRIALLLALLTLAGCPGGLYEPCEVAQDCDPIVADGCFTAPHTGEGWCTVLCKVDTRCSSYCPGGGTR